MNCQTCNDPTKYITGLWDGKGGAHGILCDCRNYKCKIKQNRVRETNYSEENRNNVIIENAKIGISMERVKMQRRELLITTFKMAKLLGISPSDYSNYEMCRVALPVEMADRINEVFRENGEEE